MIAEIDVVVLTRTRDPICPEVMKGIEQQVGVHLRVHRVVGESRPQDACRWESIARARNEGKRQGGAPFLLFVDDDVVLERGCIAALWSALVRRHRCAALAADYLGESRSGLPDRHVALGATLFRRAALEAIRFRWEPGRCECQCCCDDLRALGYDIAYLATAQAQHRKGSARAHASAAGRESARVAGASGRVLACFDRWHFERFRRYFLESLRAAGNDEWVHVVGRGLYPSQQRALAKLRHVDVQSLPIGTQCPAVTRLEDFPMVLRLLEANCPVAYWDAGDVWFQGPLAPLWNEVRANPEKLLAARELWGHPENKAVAEWTLSIADPAARTRVFELLAPRPYLNSGFAAGTAATLLRYFRESHRLKHGRLLAGSTDWGDQTALNVYCHSDPDRWHEVSDAWNYCLCGRKAGEFFVTAKGRLSSRSGAPIHVIHGNAGRYRGLFDRLRDCLSAAPAPQRAGIGAG